MGVVILKNFLIIKIQFKLMFTIEKIDSLRQQCQGMKIGFTCSSFDLLHAGHYLMLKDAKKQCDCLIVGLHLDPTLDTDYRNKTNDPGKKKNIPIQSFEERKIQVEGCRYVDHIIEYSTESDLMQILQQLKPDIRILGTDWKNKEYTGHQLDDIDIYWHQRDHDYSTSNLRKRIYQTQLQLN